MLVEEIMHRIVHTVEPELSIREAFQVARQHRIRHLPVVKEGRLVGIITDRDLGHALLHMVDDEPAAEALAHPVSEVMRREIITAHPLDFVEEAARLLYQHNIGCLPVVHGERLTGILTRKDVFKTLIEMFGVHQPSQHVEVEVADKIGVLAEVSRIFSQHKTNIHRVMVYPGRQPGRLKLVFRVQAINMLGALRDIVSAGHRVLWPPLPPDAGKPGECHE
ncbi:acetoin utilization protein AcuB [Marinithermofilum abyssi]|uniref:Acetoin utilization protein AcuB n=1 Tax=Marinithermofilum abyssi TaxID=1571185 RepID=A0A8J2VI12_9BACL|nr:CBS and ACT domain-containing protein [Marinithermofilum abyssi]GGE19849.1 acetoin utilization protein AcuB [Marinithermofilum abyssi]